MPEVESMPMWAAQELLRRQAEARVAELQDALDHARKLDGLMTARIAELEAALRTIAEPGVIPGGPVAFARKALAAKGKENA